MSGTRKSGSSTTATWRPCTPCSKKSMVRLCRRAVITHRHEILSTIRLVLLSQMFLCTFKAQSSCRRHLEGMHGEALFACIQGPQAGHCASIKANMHQVHVLAPDMLQMTAENILSLVKQVPVPQRKTILRLECIICFTHVILHEA